MARLKVVGVARSHPFLGPRSSRAGAVNSKPSHRGCGLNCIKHTTSTWEFLSVYFPAECD